MKKTTAAKTWWLLILMAAIWIPGSMCRASVEPELTMAIRHRNVQRVQILLSEGVDVNERDEGEEQTPLMRAVQVGDMTLVKMLIAHGADVRAQDDAGNTALMFAAQRGDYQIVQVLLENGADMSSRNVAGTWPVSLSADCAGSISQSIRSSRKRAPLRNTGSARNMMYKPGVHIAFQTSP